MLIFKSKVKKMEEEYELFLQEIIEKESYRSRTARSCRPAIRSPRDSGNTDNRCKIVTAFHGYSLCTLRDQRPARRAQILPQECPNCRARAASTIR